MIGKESSSHVSEARYLLDTNILVYLISGGSDRLRARMETEVPNAVATSTLCVAELLFGLDKDAGTEAALADLLHIVPPLPFDLEAARAFVEVPFRRGRLDRLIAAQALSRGLVVVTNNKRDFADVPGLKIENWT